MNGLFKFNNSTTRSVFIEYKTDDGKIFKVDTITMFGTKTDRVQGIMTKTELMRYLKTQVKVTLSNKPKRR